MTFNQVCGIIIMLKYNSRVSDDPSISTRAIKGYYLWLFFFNLLVLYYQMVIGDDDPPVSVIHYLILG